MRVLYVNHTGLVSGAERSLLTLLESLPGGVEPLVACPAGSLADAARAMGLPVSEVRATDGSLRLHPVHTSRALVDLARATVGVRAAAKRASADLVHANTIRAGLVACAVARTGGPPAVVHVRDRLPSGAVSDLTLRTIVAGARVVIANSRYTASRIPPGSAELRVVPNPLSVERFSPSAVDREAARSRLGIDPAGVVLAVVGQITPWKGQDLAIRATGELSDLDASLHLLIVGSAKFTSSATRFDNRAYAQELHGLVEELGLDEVVRFLGEREDVPDILAASDLVLVPSHEEPFGRVIIEAMAMGVPVIATEVGGPAEIIRDGVDGLLLPPQHPSRWAEAIRDLIGQPEAMREMGRRGQEQAVARFGVDRHVEAVLEAYGVALGDGDRGHASA